MASSSSLPRQPVALCAAMLVAAASAWALTPRLNYVAPPKPLEDTVPQQFGDWRLANGPATLAPITDGTETSQEQPYDQTVLRTYVNSRGDTVMLALAWGRRQRQDVKVHRPEVCYPAQGYAVVGPSVDTPLTVPHHEGTITARSLMTRRGDVYEAVRYWIRIGNRYGGDGIATRLYLLQEGLKGQVPDGILVRASLRLPKPEGAATAYGQLDAFLQDLVAAVPPETRDLLVR